MSNGKVQISNQIQSSNVKGHRAGGSPVLLGTSGFLLSQE
jgi:hypothetical protein